MGGTSCHSTSTGNTSSSCGSYAFSDVQLSTGAIIGIVIGCIVAILLVIVIVIFVLRAIARRPPIGPSGQQPYHVNPPQPYVINPAQSYSQPYPAYAPPQPPPYSTVAGNHHQVKETEKIV